MTASRMAREIIRADFNAFLHRAFLELYPGTAFEPNWHLEVLAAKLEEVRTGKCKRLIVNMPPRTLKSDTVSVIFPAWVLGHDPTKQILTVSYAQDLSDKLARSSRTLMTGNFYKNMFDTRLSSERNAVGEFETTAGGYRLSTSVGGVVTGRGADIIIVDDPLKADDALSDVRREAVNAWHDNTLRSRLNRQSEGATIVVMQRLHADDLVAHLLETADWDVLSFPAIAKKQEHYEIETPYGLRVIDRQPGDLLHPVILPAAELESLRRGMNDYNFAAQYEQDPQPPSGLIVKRDWLHFYDDKDMPAQFEQIVDSWDTASKATELSDYSVCTTWGVKYPYAYLLDVRRERMEFPALKREVRSHAALWRASVVLIEDKSSGTQLIQELRADGFSIVQAAPAAEGDKIMRLRVQTAKIEGGFVLFPRQRSGIDEYLKELTTFPNAKHDDQVDSTTQFLAWLGNLPTTPGWGVLEYYRQESEKKRREEAEKPTSARQLPSNPWPNAFAHWRR